MRPEFDSKSLPIIDLHRRTAAEAVRILARELHAARVRGAPAVLVITGRGYGNESHAPILRGKVEQWLASADARGRGVRSFRRVHRDGALEVRLVVPGARAPGEGDDADDEAGELDDSGAR